MKRFRFQLEPVLSFKQQRLDALLVEMSALQARVRAQEELRDRAYRNLADYDGEYAQRQEEGMTIVEALECQSCRYVLEQRARREDEELHRLRLLVEKKREEVVEARKETHTLERLKDIRRNEYNTAAAKAEEKSLDDLTAARRFAANAEAQAAG